MMRMALDHYTFLTGDVVVSARFCELIFRAEDMAQGAMV